MLRKPHAAANILVQHCKCEGVPWTPSDTGLLLTFVLPLGPTVCLHGR